MNYNSIYTTEKNLDTWKWIQYILVRMLKINTVY